MNLHLEHVGVIIQVRLNPVVLLCMERLNRYWRRNINISRTEMTVGFALLDLLASLKRLLESSDYTLAPAS